MKEQTDERFEEFCIVEVFGHRKLAGRVSEAPIGNGELIRIDIPGEEGFVSTQFYGAKSIFSITPVSEEVARRFARGCRPDPVTRWELPEETATRTRDVPLSDRELDDPDEEELDDEDGNVKGGFF